MTSDIVVIGAGGFGREVAQLLRDIEASTGVFRFIGYLDDDLDARGRLPPNEPVVGSLDEFANWGAVLAVCAVGAPKSRRSIVERLRARGVRWAPGLVHPRAVVGARTSLGEGSIVCAGSVLTVDITIGAHVHVNLLCSVGHDAIIEDFATLSPGCGISGNVHVGNGAFLGTQAVLIPGARVGAGAIVGAGSVVLRSVPDDTTVVGVPAKRLA